MVERFHIPLEGADATIDNIFPKFNKMIDYAIAYISLSTLDYHSVWWRLFHIPESAS